MRTQAVAGHQRAALGVVVPGQSDVSGCSRFFDLGMQDQLAIT
jgi:hypothetical protein